MNSYDADNHVLNLPDCYKKTSDSNNSKMLEVERYAVNKIRETLSDIESALNIDNATGKTLDLYGARVGQPRGLATDAQYRVLIKAKIMRNLSNGSLPSILTCLCKMLNCQPTDFSIIEQSTCTVNLADVSLTAILEADFTPSQFTSLVKSLLPAGITLATSLYGGTFEFSNSESESSTTAGFRATESDETQGGYVGVLSDDDNQIILPI